MMVQDKRMCYDTVRVCRSAVLSYSCCFSLLTAFFMESSMTNRISDASDNLTGRNLGLSWYYYLYAMACD